MKHLRFFGLLLAIATVSTGVSCFFLKHYSGENVIIQQQVAAPVQYSAYTHNGEPVDFTYAADQSVNAVVHVMTTYQMRQSQMSDPFLEYFFGERNYQRAPQQQRQASGSGVILTKDGYIVTNNHVVENANEVKVVLNDKREFTAKIVGTDPTTDLALLKVEADDLPSIPIGNSDELKVGEWVLAVGNPFNLTSTVTAGIVSAKARNINILSGDMKIESFIQTDAAVNPGNSGGALVNTKGELVGINAAIASQTGSYSGYSFAIPTSIMSKVVADLKEYGAVQRALLGVQIRDIDANFAKEKDLDILEGAYVVEMGHSSAAAEAGVEKGDIITHVDGNKVKTVTELQEKISRYRPGDKVNITVLRKGSNKNFTITLRNLQGNTNVVTSGATSKDLGAKLAPISNQARRELGINYGLEVTEVSKGGRFHQAGIPKGYYILRINNQKVNTTDEMDEIIKNLQNEQEKVLFISGLLPNGKVVYYAVDMN